MRSIAAGSKAPALIGVSMRPGETQFTVMPRGPSSRASEREAAARRTRLEEQKLQQLADLQAATPRPAAPSTPAPAAPVGDSGTDDGLLARYKAAMLQTADQNWNHIGAPELTHCRVRFTQIPGGEVINVEFTSCPYDAQGREFVDRALRKTPMPYSGFEDVFLRKVELTFCYPREECTR